MATIKVINKGRHPLPQYATPQSAGMDLRANIDSPVTLRPMERRLIPTGLYIALPPGYEAQVRPRSGLALNWTFRAAPFMMRPNSTLMRSPFGVSASASPNVLSSNAIFGRSAWRTRRSTRQPAESSLLTSSSDMPSDVIRQIANGFSPG